MTSVHPTQSGPDTRQPITSLSLHRALLHPHLPQHPDIWKTIAQARAGVIDLKSRFTTCIGAFWKRIVAELPRAEDYS